MSAKLIFNCTWGRDDPERATLPFVAANVAATAGQEAVILCTVEAVRLGVRGGADDVAAPGLPKLCDILAQFIANKGTVWLCGACTKPRGITEDELSDGVVIVGAARIVEEVVAGAKTVAFS
ncbi:MAG: DsrE family protein [Candidatus Dormibacteria bacterium]